MKKKSKKITHEMVVTHNDFNNLSLAHFSPNENKILHAIVSKIKNKDTERVTITFDEIKRLTQYKRNDNRAFLASIEEVNKKLMQLNFRFEDEEKIQQFVLFPTYTIDKKTKDLTVAVNQDFTFLVNNLTREFTSYALEDFTSIKSKYALLIYPYLMQWKSVGKYTVSMEEFKRNMGLDPKYEQGNMNRRVLDPTVKELNKLFPGLNLECTKVHGLKNAVTDLIFTFNPEHLKEMRKNDVSTGAVLNEIINNVPDYYSRVCKIFGYDEKMLTKNEMRIIDEWYTVLNMDDSMIKGAYIVGGEKSNILYCNGILKAWAQRGFKEPSDVEELVVRGYAFVKGDALLDSFGNVPVYPTENEDAADKVRYDANGDSFGAEDKQNIGGVGVNGVNGVNNAQRTAADERRASDYDREDDLTSIPVPVWEDK